MLFDLNEKVGGDFSIEDTNADPDEVDIYRHFEEQHRVNEALNDDVGLRENIFGWDLNVEAIDELTGNGDEEFHDLRSGNDVLFQFFILVNDLTENGKFICH